jgi:hypothetical protein
MRRTALLLVGAVVCAAVAAPVPKPAERKLGPEWVKEKDGEDYIRKVEVQAVAQARSNYLSYSLPLEDLRRDLWVTERFGFMGKSVEMKLPGVADPPGQRKNEKPRSGYPDQMALRVERIENDEGQAVKHSVKIGKVWYCDFDGDGMFDAMEDKRDEKETRSYILMTNPEGVPSWVRIHTFDRKLNILPLRMSGYKSDVEFIFDNGKWRVETPEDRRKAEGGGKNPDKK